MLIRHAITGGATAGLAALLVSPAAFATPPEEFDAWLEAVRGELMALLAPHASGELTDDEYEAALRAIEARAFAATDPRTWTVEQIERMRREQLLWCEWTGRDSFSLVMPTLLDAAQIDSVDGASAALVALRVDAQHASQQERPLDPEIALLFLRHPRTPDLLATVQYSAPWTELADLVRSLDMDITGEMVRLTNALPSVINPWNAWGADALYLMLARTDFPEGRAVADHLRTTLLGAAERGMGLVADQSDDDRQYLVESLEALRRAPGRVDFWGSPAPPLDFVWSSVEHGPRSLADLRGKVVLLEFWATWCGPCVASFPNLRALREQYADAPFEIVSVTSSQGFTMLDGERVEHEREEDEFDAMRRFLERHPATWPVVFTRQPLWNPDYGVRGLPSSFLIGADGRVLQAGPHPGASLDVWISILDPILREAGWLGPEGAETTRAKTP